MGEKRSFLRFDVLMDAFCHMAGKKRDLKIQNLSRDGAGVISSYPLCAGEKVNIEMNIPGDNVPIILQGEIAWESSCPAQDKCHYQSGIKFKNMENGDRARLLEYVYNKWIIPSGKEGDQ